MNVLHSSIPGYNTKDNAQHKRQCTHLYEYQSLPRCSRWAYCTQTFLATTQKTMHNTKDNALTYTNTRACPGVADESIVLKHSWLQRTMHSPARIPEPSQLLQMDVLWSSIPGYTEKNALTCEDTGACPGVTGECIVLKHPWLKRTMHSPEPAKA